MVSFLGDNNMKPGKELYLLKVSLVFKLIESSIATFLQFLERLFYFFLQVCKLHKYGLYIMHYILEVSRYTNIVWNMFGTYIYRKFI